jgi:hypothetical protein
MKKLGLGFFLLAFFLGTMNVGFAQFQVNQKVKFKTFKKPKKDLCKYQIRQEIKKSDKDNDVDWEFDESQCSILAIPPKAPANTVVVQCIINARVVFLFGSNPEFMHKTVRPCIFDKINPSDLELVK